MLGTGCFRVNVPEEGALLVAVWLMARGESERAGGLIETIAPVFDRLRFYPVPNARPTHAGTGVYVQTAGEAIEALRRFAPAMQGLIAIANGERFDADGYHRPSGGRRLFGWAVGGHWLSALGSTTKRQ